ncbi:MAG: hypothetical protein GX057_00475 [Clostridiales bacterium]|nr:hypothetical protein [Clostridiales bacterium]
MKTKHGDDRNRPEGSGKINWKLLLILILNTTVIFGFYRFAITQKYYFYVMWAYMAATSALAIGYVVYNRGFSRRGVTKDMLPDTMTDEEKQAFIDDGERRMKKSKWMLTLLFPFIFTFIYDVLELFVGDQLFRLFS